MGHLAHVEWLIVLQVSSAGYLKHKAQVGPLEDMWQPMIGYESKVDG